MLRKRQQFDVHKEVGRTRYVGDLVIILMIVH